MAAPADKKPAVDPAKAKGHQFPPTKVSYNKRDLLTYAVGIGATELNFAYENDPSFAAFPTYPVVLSLKGDSQDIVPFGVSKKGKADGFTAGIPGVPKYDPNMILHGEQSLEVLQPLPLSGDFTLTGKVLGVYDKGKGMLIEQESVLVDSKGTPIVRLVSGVFVRGLGGFGGEKQPKAPAYNPPEKPPCAVFEFQTRPDQALLYRLSGDYNPLHADPKIAKAVGFPAPILHGLCSFGIAAHGIIKHFCNNDPAKFKAIRVRFASPVFPGETLVTEMWRQGSTVIFQVKVKERNVVVISNSAAEIVWTESKI